MEMEFWWGHCIPYGNTWGRVSDFLLTNIFLLEIFYIYIYILDDLRLYPLKMTII